MIADALWIWARASLLGCALVVLFCGAEAIIGGVRRLMRTRLVRSDRPRVPESQRVIE